MSGDTLTVPQAAAELGVSQVTVRNAIHQGGLPVVRLTPRGHMRIYLPSLRAWLAAGGAAAPPDPAPTVE